MTVSISKMGQTWLTNSNSYNAISMSISTLGYGANSNSSLLRYSVDGNLVFRIDTLGSVYTPANIKSNIVESNIVNANVIYANTIIMRSNTIFVANVTANTLNVAARGITKGSMPTGSVLQVVQAIKKDLWVSIAGPTTFSGIPGLVATIKPTSASSKILVRVCVHISSDYWEVQGRLTRNGSPIVDTYGNQRSARTRCSFVWNVYSGGGTGYNFMPVYYEYLDSPNSTDELTYGVDLNGYQNYYVGVNYNHYSDPDDPDYFGCPSSTITVMEIAQ